MAGAAAEHPRPGHARSLGRMWAILMLVALLRGAVAPSTTAVSTVGDAGAADGARAGVSAGPIEGVTHSIPAGQRTGRTERAIAPRAASVTAPAERIRPWSAFDVAVVGDSLTEMGLGRLSDSLVANGWRPLVDGKASRSISYPADLAYSAVDRVAEIKAAGFDPDTWLVQLGTNDLYFIINCRCGDVRLAAIERVRMMLDAIGPGHRVVWVGVQNFEYRDTTAMFNEILRELVGTGEISGVVDWATMSAGHRSEFFADSAHLSDTGYEAWIPAVVDVLGEPAS